MEDQPPQDLPLDDCNTLAGARRAGDVLILEPAGDLTVHTSGAVRRDVLKLVETHNPKRVIFNLARVELCDSSGVAVFIETLGKLGGTPGGNTVCAVEAHERVRGMIEICRLTTIIKIAESEAQALAAG